jgi:hypothetical protein
MKRKSTLPYNGNKANAALEGDLPALILLYDSYTNWETMTTYNAAKGGHLDCLQFAHENGCEWHEATQEVAAKNGHYECMMYAYTHGCPWTDRVLGNAGKNGHFDCLKFAYENGAEPHENSDNPYDEDDETLFFSGCNGHSDCFVFAHENNFPRGSHIENMTEFAVENGHTDTFLWMLFFEYPLGEHTLLRSIQTKNKKCVQYIVEYDYHDIKPDILCMIEAVNHGDPDLIGWGNIYDFWSEDWCSYAASKNEFLTLKWLVEEGCPWDKDTPNEAAKHFSFQCLHYAYQQGCPFLLDEVIEALKTTKFCFDTVNYLFANLPERSALFSKEMQEFLDMLYKAYTAAFPVYDMFYKYYYTIQEIKTIFLSTITKDVFYNILIHYL